MIKKTFKIEMDLGQSMTLQELRNFVRLAEKMTGSAKVILGNGKIVVEGSEADTIRGGWGD